MSKEKGLVIGAEESVKAAKVEELLDFLIRRHSRYCLELAVLIQTLATDCRRRETRHARLEDLQQRLLPQLQARIDSLQAQKGGGIF